jgi:hypothetical protein
MNVLVMVMLASLVLFNGHSLAGWSSSGDARWSVVENVIVAEGSGDGFLLTEQVYDNFELTLEFWVDATTNSGIFIRCQDRQRIHPDTCYELNIWDEHPQQEARTGAVVFRFMPPLVKVDTIGKWNRYDIRANGPNIEVSVNGQVTAHLDDANADAGFIALQHWQTGTVKFRNIQLRVLEKES